MPVVSGYNYPKVFRFQANALCLDFANAMHWPRTKRVELLESYDKLIEWGRLAGLDMSRGHVRDARGRARALASAIAVRDLVQRICYQQLDTGRPRAADLAALTIQVQAAHARRVLAMTADGPRWVTSPEVSAHQRVIDVVVRSLDALLTGGDLTRLKACQRCDWLFLDASKNGARRWCSMRSCGSHSKSQAYYRRKRATRAQAQVAA
jgi:predicted RNA-binding Zn ribbon-like protein